MCLPFKFVDEVSLIAASENQRGFGVVPFHDGYDQAVGNLSFSEKSATGLQTREDWIGNRNVRTLQEISTRRIGVRFEILGGGIRSRADQLAFGELTALHFAPCGDDFGSIA